MDTLEHEERSPETKTLKTSIIISFYQRIGHLKGCLDSLRHNANDVDEVIIADDGSSQEVVKEIESIIPQYPFEIKHVWHPKDGFRLSTVRNNGIRAATGDYLIFMDCDFAVLPGTIKLHKRFARPKQFVAGLCKYLPELETQDLMNSGISSESLEHHYAQLPEKPISRAHFKFWRYSWSIRLGLSNPRKQRCSSHFSIFHDDVKAINGYDENFVGWGGEDEDMSYRMVKAGYRGYALIKQAKVLHMWHPKELGNKHWKEGSNMEYLYRENIPTFCENGLVKL